jgi:hypothetical protein
LLRAAPPQKTRSPSLSGSGSVLENGSYSLIALLVTAMQLLGFLS